MQTADVRHSASMQCLVTHVPQLPCRRYPALLKAGYLTILQLGGLHLQARSLNRDRAVIDWLVQVPVIVFEGHILGRASGLVLSSLLL